MESFFSRFKNTLVLIAVLLIQTVGLATQVNRPEDAAHPDGTQVRLLRLWAAAIVTPFERMSVGSGHGMRHAWENYIALRSVRQQNKALEQQLARQRLELAALAEDALQGQRLRATLAFKQNYVAMTLVAQVIGTSGNDQSRLLTLDKGWHDGLKAGMAVITPDGIVGKLRDVFPGTSQLLLISDTTSGAGVVLASTRIRAILHGTPQGRIVINNLMPDARIRTGETVLTSGGDQVFPRGLPVGVIESIAPDPDHQPYSLITLKPAARLNEMEEVLIITSMGATSDSLAALAAADPVAHAADISADRLPSLHPDKATAPDPATPDTKVEAPPTENSTGLVPRPKPVNHPDRYSPGAAPRAEQLVPGAPQH